MKKVLLCAIAVITAFSATCQTAQNDVVKSFLGEAQFELLEQESPEKLQFYVFLNEEGYAVENIAPKSTVDFPDALNVEGVNSEVAPITTEMLLNGEFNGLLYKFDRQIDETRYYRIGDSEGMVLIVYPTRYIQRLFEEQ